MWEWVQGFGGGVECRGVGPGRWDQGGTGGYRKWGQGPRGVGQGGWGCGWMGVGRGAVTFAFVTIFIQRYIYIYISI